MRNIRIITGSRAEYSLLRSMMQEIQAAETLQLQILASGNFELGTWNAPQSPSPPKAITLNQRTNAVHAQHERPQRQQVEGILNDNTDPRRIDC